MSAATGPIKSIGETALLDPSITFSEISDTVCGVTERDAPRGWWVAFLIAASFTGLLGMAIGYLVWEGVGVWGNNSPVYWAWDITNFVWWIGIGHAGTLISAVLFLFRQKWRTSINRFAEAMTIFAVICALIFPGIHVGRAWVAYYLFPLPNSMASGRTSRARWSGTCSPSARTSPSRSSSGSSVSSPTSRSFATAPPARCASCRTAPRLSDGAARTRHWQNYERAYLILAALSTPLVLSVQLGRFVRLRDLAACPAGTRRSSRRTSSPAPSSPASRWS